MKILVTGGAGFIGSHLVDALVERGHEVIIVDDLSRGFAENLNPRARFYQIDLLASGLEAVFERERPEVVSHHAAQIDVARSVKAPLLDAQQNILGSLKVLENCLRFGVRKVIFASSGGAIYGEVKYLPVDEEHPINPISGYGISKYAVEQYLHLCALHYGLDYVVLRYANVYGPRQDPYGEGGVVAVFTRQMLEGQRPTIYGAGDKTRDYIHVADVVEANLLALERGKASAFNIGSGVETSDQEIFDELARLLDYKGSPLYAPVRKGEIYRICLDSSKAQRELGWSPRLTLREGLEGTVAYYKSRARPLGK